MATRGKEKFLSYNTLSVLLIAMKHRKVEVETINESMICGKLDEADGFGNLWLSNATIFPLCAPPVKLRQTFVKASSVRYVHLPEDVDPIKAITDELNRPKSSGKFKVNKGRK